MCEEKEEHIHRLFGGDSEKDPPVPIPNTEVKLLNAESTCLDTDRKDRTPPNFYSSLAQSVEPAAVNRVVVGSSPTGGAICITYWDLNISFVTPIGNFLYSVIFHVFSWRFVPILLSFLSISNVTSFFKKSENLKQNVKNRHI